MTAQAETRTPGPWHASDYAGKAHTGIQWEIEPAIAVMFGSNPSSQANRDFIVRACNAHDQLIAALRLIEEHATLYGLDTARDIARAALAAAGEAS